MSINIKHLESNIRNFDANNPHHYSNTFDYKQYGSNYDQLNFVYLIEKNLFAKILKKFGLSQPHFHLENSNADLPAVNAIDFTNREILDQQKIQSLDFISQSNFFQPLSYLIKDLEEDEIQFVSYGVVQFLQNHIENFVAVKKVAYISNNMIKFELYNPIVNVVFISNDEVKKKKMHKQLKNQVLKISISRFISRTDLANILIEICQTKLNLSNSEIYEHKILLPKLNDITAKHFKQILECQAEITEVKSCNLSQYEIYQDRLIIFYYKDKFSEFNLKFRQRKNSVSNNASASQQQCNFCGQGITILDADYCICKRHYCDSRCRQRDQKHDCKPLICAGCDLKMIQSDLNNLQVCECGELLCQKRCYNQHQRRTGCLKVQLKPLTTLNKGQVGLYNIGNTCYMNSALQCMLHSDLLRQFFCFYDFSKEININNPLGTKGQLLNEVSNLFREYYKTSKQYLTPSDLKYCIASHITTFEGYGQHDSQELLSSLIDQVHEDLNRILHKPATQPIEGVLGDDIQSLARRSWLNYLKRNYSFFTENFYGQFKNIMVCPQCNNNSVTFDPFQLISLSIPIVQTINLEYFYIDADHNSKAIQASISMKSINKFNDIKVSEVVEKLSEILKIDESEIVLAALGFTCIGEIFNNSQGVSQLLFSRQKTMNRPKIFACQLNDYEIQCKKTQDFQYVFLRFNYECYDTEENLTAYELFQLKKKYPDYPIFTKFTIVNKSTTVQDVYAMVLRKLVRITNIKDQLPQKQALQTWHEFYLNILSQLTTKLKNKQFFFIKIESTNEVLQPQDTSKFLSKINTEKKVILNVFLRNEDNTTTTLNLNQFLNYDESKNLDMQFYSQDLKNYKSSFTLDNLLENFQSKEILDEQNSWYCGKCKKHVQASKTLKIYKLPHYLIIHFKKLKNLHAKIPMIQYPLKNLDMSKYVINSENIQQYNIQPEEFYQQEDMQHFMNLGISPMINTQINSSSTKYDLYGVVEHSGSQHFGHYVANCKLDDGNWYEFNDQRVSQINAEDVVSHNAYILFYKRNNQLRTFIQFAMEVNEKCKQWIDTLQQRFTKTCFDSLDELQAMMKQDEKHTKNIDVDKGFEYLKQGMEKAINMNMDSLEEYFKNNVQWSDQDDIQQIRELESALDCNNKSKIEKAIKKIEIACEQFKLRRQEKQKEQIRNIFHQQSEEQFKKKGSEFNLPQQEKQIIIQVEEHEKTLTEFQDFLDKFLLDQVMLEENLN